MGRRPSRTPRTLFQKYFVALFLAVSVPLTIAGISDAWFGYRDQRANLDQQLGTEARSAADKIHGFLDGIIGQLGWLVQLPWTDEPDERRRIDALRLLRQVPAVVNLTAVDGAGRERLFISRIGLNRIEGRTDRSREPAIVGAVSAKVWFSELSFYRGSEPYISVALAGNRPSAGIVVAEVNLKLIWDVISAIRVGKSGHAFVLDTPGRLVAHPDISLVLRGSDEATVRPFQAIRTAVKAAGTGFATVKDPEAQSVAAAAAPIPGVGWTVVVEQPLSEAFGPIYAALWRTGGLLLIALALAALLAFGLARRLTIPIRLLELGTRRIGAGRFEHRIEIKTGDELQRLAESFNAMAAGLAVSQERQERIAKLKRFLAPQVAELVDRAGDDTMLEGRRSEVVALFGDLRGFTAFSAKVRPEEVMTVLSEYYEALGNVINRHEATLISYSGDGLMVLVNAPVPVAEPAIRAVDLAIDMQNVVQNLIANWHMKGYRIGFGVGLANGQATVGRIGYESRFDYTAIGSVVNLASRLCSSAQNAEILLDAETAKLLAGRRSVRLLGEFQIKGFEDTVHVFAVEKSTT